MSNTNEKFAEAKQWLSTIQADVFFQKLAHLGVTPTTDEEARALFKLGDEILANAPRCSDAGQAVKQASYETFQNDASRLGTDGYSADAHLIIDSLCQYPEFVKSAQFVLSLTNA